MSEETTEPTAMLACGDATPRDRRNLRHYQTMLALFALSYVAAATLLRSGVVSHEGAGWFVALTPSLVALLPVAAFMRFLSDADELQRLIQLQALATGLAAGFVLWPALRLLDRLGLAGPAWYDALSLAVISSYVVGIVRSRSRYR